MTLWVPTELDVQFGDTSRATIVNAARCVYGGSGSTHGGQRLASLIEDHRHEPAIAILGCRQRLLKVIQRLPGLTQQQVQAPNVVQYIALRAPSRPSLNKGRASLRISSALFLSPTAAHRPSRSAFLAQQHQRRVACRR